MNTRSQNALLSIGIDTLKVDGLLRNGYNLRKLQELNKTDLQNIGLTEGIINLVYSKNRPAISEKIIVKLLYESKMTCCICRDNSKSVVIHHIDEWSSSKNHSDDNLVVLCLQHHDEAHTKRHLSLSLSKDRILGMKVKWIESVKNQDSKSILGLIGDWSRWDYVNINRVFEFYIQFNMMVEKNDSISYLMENNIINKRGIPNPVELWSLSEKPTWYMSDFGMGIDYNYYLKVVVEFIIKKIPLIDLTNKMNITFIKALIKPGVIITAQLGYYFSDIDGFQESKRQMRKGYYQGNSIRIEFVFDAWECTSSSGRFDALTGHKVAVPILFVKSIQQEEHTLKVNCSCLAIGTWFNNHRERSWM